MKPKELRAFLEVFKEEVLAAERATRQLVTNDKSAREEIARLRKEIQDLKQKPPADRSFFHVDSDRAFYVDTDSAYKPLAGGGVFKPPKIYSSFRCEKMGAKNPHVYGVAPSPFASAAEEEGYWAAEEEGYWLATGRGRK